MRRTSLLGPLLAALTLTACGSSGTPPVAGSASASVLPATPVTSPASTTARGPSTGTNTPPAGTPATAAPRPTTAPLTTVACGETTGWGTGPKTAAAMNTEPLYLVRVGRHDCYDRVVFDVNGQAEAGFAIRYVPVVTADPKGDPLPVPGGAVLQVVVRAPALGYDSSGHQPGQVLARTGDYLYTAAQLAGWPSLRAIRFAGSFEGLSTFAVGVRTKLTFRVFILLDPVDQILRVVLDVAR